MYGWMDGWIDYFDNKTVLKFLQVGSGRYKLIIGWMDEWIDGWMNGWMNG
jgi:hypothetical protein